MHFVVMGDDNIRYLPPIDYQRIFIFLALGLAIFEGLGVFMGGYAFWTSHQRQAAVTPKKGKRRVVSRLD
jgi:hypothetical protein